MQKSNKHKCNYLMILVYLVVQFLLVLTIDILRLHLCVHLVFVGTSVLTYILVTTTNPGYVKLEQQRKDKNAKKASQKELPQNKGEVAQNRNSKLNPRLQSSIKAEKSSIQPPTVIKNTQKNIKIDKTPQKIILPVALKEVQRYCHKCKHQQQLRVRHCVECGQCVRTFDHHCPWINNCVGQKNKLYFMLYLLAQQTQFFVLAVDLTINVMASFQISILMLCIGSYMLGLTLSGIFCFHLYAIANNITTWEHIRWNRIEYLNIFTKVNLKSLFDRGIRLNISVFMRSNCSRQPMNWEEQVNPAAQHCLVATNSSTQRRLSQLVQ